MHNLGDLGLAILLVTSPIWIVITGWAFGEKLAEFFEWLDE